MSDLELQCEKFNLKEGDNLVIKVNTSGLSQTQVAEQLQKLSNDEFVEYVKSKGHGVFVTYSGIDLQILRMQEEDKLSVYVNLDLVNAEEQEQYLNLIEERLSGIAGKFFIVPCKNDSVKTRVTNEKGENNE